MTKKEAAEKPQIEYPAQLPVTARRHEIAHAIKNHQVVIVAGETGSGKTTQLPKICLELDRKNIAHTQPRRIAARTVAERIAEELRVPLGGLVGYQVRFNDRVSSATRIRIMTDGILLNTIHHDPLLQTFDTIIIDEAHERSLNIDFLLGYLKTILPARPELRVIITSATIDPASFAKHFTPNPEEKTRTPNTPNTSSIRNTRNPKSKPHTPALTSTPQTRNSSHNNTKTTPTTQHEIPIIEVSGRSHPVEVRYRPPVDIDLYTAIVQATEELARETPGDILVFLSGEAEIRDAREILENRFKHAQVLPLYGRLSIAEQHRVFNPGKPDSETAARKTVTQNNKPPEAGRLAGCRIVLATNVAETSLTVPGIRYVIDAGQARISRYSTRSKVQRLPIEAISQASAKQRAGRAGRTSAGIAIRLYTEEDYESRPLYTDPEIRRTGLAAVILQMLALGIGDIESFPFLTPPDRRGVLDGLALLHELGAVQGGGKKWSITSLGRKISRIPLEPRFARMILEAEKHGVVPELLALVTGLTIQDPRERPGDRQQQAAQAHSRFKDPTGDLMTLLNLWNHVVAAHEKLSSSAFRRLCRDEYLNFLRVREWFDLFRQVERALPRELSREGAGTRAGRGGVHPPDRKSAAAGANVSAATNTTANSDANGAARRRPSLPRARSGCAEGVHRSVIAGLLSQLGLLSDLQDKRGGQGRGKTGRGGKRRQAREFAGSRGTRFVLHPSSVLAGSPPAAVMCVELVETSRLFARMNAQIDPVWAEEAAGDLAKRQLGEPFWQARRASAGVHESVTLFGVPIVLRRRVQLSRFDRVLAREFFVRHALVLGEWRGHADWRDAVNDRGLYGFAAETASVRLEVEGLAHRVRRPELAANEQLLFDFYDARVPVDVFSLASFERWWRRERAVTPELLTPSRELFLRGIKEVSESEFPREWHSGEQCLELRYRFDPGARDDGVSVRVPLALLPGMRSAFFSDLVPGARVEFVAALLRTLPKRLRRYVVPAADWAVRLVAVLEGADVGLQSGQFVRELARVIGLETGASVSVEDFDLAALPARFLPNYQVLDAAGDVVASGRHLEQLQLAYGREALGEISRLSVAANAGVDVPADAQMNAAGVGDAGQGRAEPGVDVSGREAAGSVLVSGLTDWPVSGVRRSLVTSYAGGSVRAFPALQDCGRSVSVVVCADELRQCATHAGGLARLLCVAAPGVSGMADYVADHLTNAERLLFSGSSYGGVRDVVSDCVLAFAFDFLEREAGLCDVWDGERFAGLAEGFSAVLIDGLLGVLRDVAVVLEGARVARKALGRVAGLNTAWQVRDAVGVFDGLVFRGFVSRTGLVQLRRLPVYFDALRLRADDIARFPGRDVQRMNETVAATELFAGSGGVLPLSVEQTLSGLVGVRVLEGRVDVSAPGVAAAERAERLLRARWLLEELRVSVFAQQLGTAAKVSVQRIRKLLQGG